jgi:xylulokinase
MSLIGLDIGTNACKAILFDEAGALLGVGAREYAILSPRPGWAEQDAEAVWRAALEALRLALSSAGQERVRRDPPVAMALSVQGEAVMPVDGNGRPLRHAILGMDTRTGAQNAWLARELGADWLVERTGMPLHTINTLPKLLWLRQHEPAIWRQAHQFLLYEDYFLRRLGGRATISHCLASRTQMYHMRRGAWDEDILARCGIEPERLAPLGEGPVGELSADVRAALGLSQPVLLAAGGHDQACAALGAGVIAPGQAMVSTGTAEVVELALESPTLSSDLSHGGISVYRHVVPGLYVAMTLNHSGGLTLRWFRDALCAPERDAALAAGQDPYDALLSAAPEGPTRLLMLPHLVGSGTPTLDTASKGAILGLTYSTTKAEIAKAALEGLTFELRLNLDLLRAGGARIERLHAVGGGARSPLWLQLKADVCDVPLRVPRVTEAACLGAALLAGTAAGVYADLPEAVRAAVTLDREILPDAAMSAAYAPRYALYQQVYPLLKELNRRL